MTGAVAAAASHSAELSVGVLVEPSDAQLVAALRRRESNAFSSVYERYRASIFMFLVRLCGSREVAEDLSQETWIRLARHAGRLAPDTRLAAWLFTVARRLYISHRRWSLADAARRLGWWSRAPSWVDHHTPDALADAAETARLLESAIAHLPERYREVLLLVTSQQLETGAIAEMLGVSPETVRQRLSRARAIVASALGGQR